MKVKIDIPENLSEITLDQFQRYTKLVNDNEPSEFVNQKIIEIFCNIKLSEVAKISYKDTQSILDHIQSIFEVNTQLKRTFTLFGVEYGFVPDLENITSGEYIDAESYLKDIQTLHSALAVLYRPIIAKTKNLYTIEDYETAGKYEAIMKNATMDVVLGMQVFFYNLGIELANATKDFLLDEAVIADIAKKNNLEINGDGINQYMQQLEGMYSTLRELQIYPLPNS